MMENVIVFDRGESNSNHYLRIAIDEKPEALIFKQRIYSDVCADVCADCGHIKFFAVNPEILWTAYQNREKKL